MSKFIDELIKELVKHSTTFTAKSIADAIQDLTTTSASEFLPLRSHALAALLRA